MTIDEYKNTLRSPLRLRTVCFLIKDMRVMLGLKKRGFGQGYFMGIGGKVEENESIEEGAIREVKEEVNVKIEKYEQIGILNFYFPHIIDESWNQQVHAFMVTEWFGEPAETEEIKPYWFEKDSIPLDKMWDDARFWLPRVINGEHVKEDFLLNSDLKVMQHI